jgi:hypothetical protein
MMQHKDLKVEVHSILAAPGEGSSNESSLWGLYVHPGKEDALNWKLPFQTVVAGADAFVPNELLIDTLIDALAPYREDVQKIVDEENLGATKDILDKLEAILKALPHPVSEQLRKLLVDPVAAEGGLTFFHNVGLDRLQQIIVIYTTLIELLGYTILAQLWELSNKEGIKISDEHRSKLRTFFTDAPSNGQSSSRFFDLVSVVRGVLADNSIECFVAELSSLTEKYAENAEFRESIAYLEQARTKIAEKTIDTTAAKEMCVIAEQKLAEFFKHLGFLSNYTLASVKSIDVLNYRHFKTPKFKHHLVKLELRLGGLAENQEIVDQLLDCNSVLIMRLGDQKQFLNLSPFVIDENAFDAKASIAKLYFFDRYDKTANTYAFRHVYKPTDAPLLVQQQKHFQILKAQFDAFSQSLFEQPMQAL